MLYPKNLEQKLGFDRIREELLAACESSLGQEFVRKIRFSNNKKHIRRWLEQTDEFVKIIHHGELFPASNYLDISPLLKKAAIENAFLMEEEFFELILTLKTLHKCLEFFKEKGEAYPVLDTLTSTVIFEEKLLWHLSDKFDERGKLKDNASDALYEIRKGIQSEQQRLRRVLDSLLKRAKNEGFTPENVSITIRDGRMVIPLLAEYKRRIKGFVHGESASGQTVYLEPTEVLEINNGVKELQYAEKREVTRILIALTDLLKPELSNLEDIPKFLGLIDFIRAKARFAIKINACKPQEAVDKGFAWQKAKHPILFLSFQGQGKTVVPLNIRLSAKERVLLISGPNAGGKSVCLKTVGLLQYMYQSGLLVPVDELSTFTLFDDLFIDIGDEQSLENDLSTYSSHLVNMKHFLLHTGKKSLFLIDEFGTGTEPQFGGAIAEAILDELNHSKGMGVITTHYGNLKEFANRTSGLMNGAMKYDLKKLQPLYTLETGKPGSSFALEIAQKIGLPKNTINAAKSRIGMEQVSLDQLLGNLESQKNEIDEAKRRIKAREKELEETSRQYAELKFHLESKEKNILNQAKQEAAALLKSANRQVERTIREIRESKADQTVVKTLRKTLDESGKKLKVEKKKPKSSREIISPVKGEIKVGDYVQTNQGMVGQVLHIKGKDVEISIGSLTSRVKLGQLQKVTRKQAKAENQLATIKGVSLNERASSFSPKLDIRGYRAEEVIPKLDRWMDEAIVLGMQELHILHGKGNGILRTIVRDHLSTFPAVNSMQDEHADRGGAGVTIVTMK